MFFGPPGILPAPQPPTSESALAETVRTTAHRLLDDLQRVSHFTASQHDRALGDALVEVALSFCLARLAATGVWGEANRTASSILWHIAGPCLELGWLQHRARFKPRGYAGDEELLTRICRGEECNSDLGRLFDRYFLRQAAPQAVRAAHRANGLRAGGPLPQQTGRTVSCRQRGLGARTRPCRSRRDPARCLSELASRHAPGPRPGSSRFRAAHAPTIHSAPSHLGLPREPFSSWQEARYCFALPRRRFPYLQRAVRLSRRRFGPKTAGSFLELPGRGRANARGQLRPSQPHAPTWSGSATGTSPTARPSIWTPLRPRPASLPASE